MIDLGIDSPNSYGLSINGFGQVTGYYWVGSSNHAFLYSDGHPIDLMIPGGYARAQGINDSGQITGGNDEGAFLYSQGHVITLPTLGLVDPSHIAGGEGPAYAINSSGEIVGWSRSVLAACFSTGGVDAFLYSGGHTTDLTDSDNCDTRFTYSIAYAINDSGQVTGNGRPPGASDGRAFLYSDGHMVDLGAGEASYGYGVNNVGQVTGDAGEGYPQILHAFLYSDGHLYDLNDLIPPGSGWRLLQARGINDAGQIVGAGFHNGNGRPFLATPISNGPVINSVHRQYPGVTLQDAPVINRFDVSVNWHGDPGSVRFVLNGVTLATEPGTPTGASHSFDMTNLTPSSQPLLLNIIATNAAGQESRANIQQICLVPLPFWLSTMNPSAALNFSITNGKVNVGFSRDIPDPHFAKEGADQIDVPDWVPVFGGKYGFAETYVRIKASFSNLDTEGSLTISGQTGVKVGDQELDGKITGKGKFGFGCSSGLTLDSGTVSLLITGLIKKKESLLAAIPPLRRLQTLPVIGKTITWLDQIGEVTTSYGPFGNLSWNFQQGSDGDIHLVDGTDQVGGKLTSTFKTKIIPQLSAEAWVTGQASLTVGWPQDPFFRQGALAFEAGIKLTLSDIIRLAEFKAQVDYAGTYAPDTGWKIVSSAPLERVSAQVPSLSAGIIERDYSRFGPYVRFNRAGGPSRIGAPGTTLISNTFPGASPNLVKLNNGNELLLWVYQDTSLPVTQSTGVMWQWHDAQGNWSSPQLISNDTQAEFSPVAGVDGNGRVVAAWLRVKDNSFSDTISTMDDVAAFYKDFEVVTADFDPATQAWSEVTPLTDDMALDTDLQLSSDGSGGLLLSWLSNPDAELMSTGTSPSQLKYSVRSAGSWTAPAIAANALIGVSHHAVATKGTGAFIILPRNPDVDSNAAGVLDLFRYSNGSWSSQGFAPGDVDNRLPSVAYDGSGIGHVIWIRGTDLVSATIDDPTPHLVRSGSDDLGFYDAELVAGAHNDLVLIYRQATSDGIGNFFIANYDPTSNKWYNGKQILPDSREVGNVSAYFDAQNTLHLAYTATQIDRISQVVTIDGQEYTIENIPQEGETDLEVATLSSDSLFGSRLANISTRLQVFTGDNVLIGGFIVTGTQPKKVMVRGIGPSLPVSGALADPTLELYDAHGLLASNDNWRSDQESDIIDSTIPPTNDNESAIIATLPANNSGYTTILRGANNTTGVGLVEVYDLDGPIPSRLTFPAAA